MKQTADPAFRRNTPPPNHRSILKQSFKEFDREHLRIELLERSLLARYAKDEESRRKQVQRNGTLSDAYHISQQHRYVSEKMQSQKIQRNSNPLEIQILGKEKVQSLQRSAKRVQQMRKYHEEMEQAERVTKQIFEIHKAKKRVSMLLCDLDAPISETRAKEKSRAKQSVELKLDYTLKLKEDADSELRQSLLTKDSLSEFVLEPPPDFLNSDESSGAKKRQNPKEIMQAAEDWQKKAIANNVKLLRFINMLRDDSEKKMLELESKIEDADKKRVAAEKRVKKLEQEILSMHRQVSDMQTRVKQVEAKRLALHEKLESAQAAFTIRTAALRTQITDLEKQEQSIRSQLHITETERDNAQKAHAAAEARRGETEAQLKSVTKELKHVRRAEASLKIQLQTVKQEFENEREEHSQEKARLEQAVADEQARLKLAQAEVKRVELQAKKDLEEQATRYEAQVHQLKTVVQSETERAEEAERRNHSLKRELSEERDRVAAVEDKAKASEAKRLENEEIARIQAEEAARRLAAAQWRPNLVEIGTQTDKVEPTKIITVLPNREVPVDVELERQLMLQEDRDATCQREKDRIDTISNEFKTHLKCRLEELRGSLEKSAKDAVCQTPLEFLKSQQQSLENKDLQSIIQDERLARKVLKRWMRKAVLKIFLADDELSKLINKLDFDREGPAPDLLRLLRKQQIKNTRFAKSILRHCGNVVSRERVKTAFDRLKVNFLVGRAEDSCIKYQKAAARRADRASRLQSRIEAMKTLHEHETHDLQLGQLREAAMSSSEQAKTLKSISTLIVQVSEFVKYSKAALLYQIPRDRPDNKDDLKRCLALAASLGEQCGRWMILIEKRLPALNAQSERVRTDIGLMRRNKPVEDVRVSPTRRISIKMMEASISVPELAAQQHIDHRITWTKEKAAGKKIRLPRL